MFITRFNGQPSQEQLSAIEGLSIVEEQTPQNVQGVGQGTCAVIGEFADMTYAVAMDASGVFSTKLQPQEVFSGQDYTNKFGGFDELLGDFGGSCGNGFIELTQKTFFRLIVQALNLCSTRGIRVFRQLPTCTSATDPTPVVPMAGGLVVAGRQFGISTKLYRTGKRVVFSDAAHYTSGTDGAPTVAAGAVTQVFISALADFVSSNVKVGDALVLGVIGGNGGANAATYRVKTITDINTLVVERLDGASFAWANTAIGSTAWRIHPGSAADGGGAVALSSAAGYTTPVRCLSADGVIGDILAPTIIPTPNAATAWDTLSGLGARNALSTITYIAALQAPNAASSATFDTTYGAAIAAFLADSAPASQVSVLWCARKSSSIATSLKSFGRDASSGAKGRMVAISPVLTAATAGLTSQAIAAAYPGVGGNRLDRLAYCWPPAKIAVPEALNIAVKQGDGTTTYDGLVDVTTDGWLAAVLSNLAPERNPAQCSPPATTVLAPIISFGASAPTLAKNDYIALRQAGVVALNIDPTFGPCFQSGVTSSILFGEKNISRRRMMDYIEDSISVALVPMAKQPMTEDWKDTGFSLIDTFMFGLKSVGNPKAQRINDYSIDDRNGNTAAQMAAGIYVWLLKVQLTPNADFLVLRVQGGETVVITPVNS